MSSLDEMFEGCLPADPLIRAEPLLWLQRLYLGQLFPARFTAAREDLTSSGSPRAGKKAVLVTTFSFGRLVCSFHEARIIMNFVCNIQRFVLKEGFLFSYLFYAALSKKNFVSPWTKVFFNVEYRLACIAFAPITWNERLFWSFFGCWKPVQKLFIHFNHFFCLRIHYSKKLFFSY